MAVIMIAQSQHQSPEHSRRQLKIINLSLFTLIQMYAGMPVTMLFSMTYMKVVAGRDAHDNANAPNAYAAPYTACPSPHGELSLPSPNAMHVFIGFAGSTRERLVHYIPGKLPIVRFLVTSKSCFLFVNCGQRMGFI